MKTVTLESQKDGGISCFRFDVMEDGRFFFAMTTMAFSASVCIEASEAQSLCDALKASLSAQERSIPSHEVPF
jgi:hypothetical protein